jgi:Zn-dependent protease with chaperone function
MDQRGLWYDGLVALERPVRVSLGPQEIVLIDETGTEHRAATSELVRLRDGTGRFKLGHRSLDGWRLVLVEPLDSAITAALPSRSGSLVPPVGRKKLALLAGISFVATAFAALVIFAPQAVAEHMPMAWERRLGAAYDLPVEAARCDDPQAAAALAHIVDRLDPKARSDGFTIELTDLDIPNAAALPGGRMIVLNGLFDDIDDPDALAGIIAHEIAHVRRRHVAAAMIREMGLGTVVTLFGGGAVASNAGGLLSLKFSRSAEAEADADAIDMLKRARIDPRPTSAAFENFRKMEGNWPEWLGSHPASGGRARQFRASYDSRRSYRPVLSQPAAKALISACRD